LVHATLVAAKVSEPAATTVQGLTLRRLWATSAALIAMVSVVGGALAGARRNKAFGVGAVVAGAIAAANGAANLAVANGGPGSGNGVVGAAAAVVLGVAGASLGAWAVLRARGKDGHFYPIQDSRPPVG
jgi:hypothetical protein